MRGNHRITVQRADVGRGCKPRSGGSEQTGGMPNLARVTEKLPEISDDTPTKGGGWGIFGTEGRADVMNLR